MFTKKLKSDRLIYKSPNEKSKISKVIFNQPLNLLQVFGAFHGQEKLQSFDMGVRGAVLVCNIHLKVSVDETSMDTLDSILNELEIIEPEFKDTKDELRAIIQKNKLNVKPQASTTSQDSLSARNKATIQALFRLRSSLSFGQTQENEYQKACRLFKAEQYEEVLVLLKKFKLENMDCNPYPYNHEKGFSVTTGANVYKMLASCYRKLHRYQEAIATYEEMKNKLHPAITLNSLQQIEALRKECINESEAAATSRQTLNPEQLSTLLKFHSFLANNPKIREAILQQPQASVAQPS